MSSSASTQAERSSLGSLEAENELRQFLKIARPEWSKPRRSGRSDVERVITKLKDVGVNDIESLIKRVESNTINEELHQHSHVPLSREALDSIRKQRTFLVALEGVDVPNIRQVGAFDPVAQMLSRKRLATAHISGGSRDHDGLGSKYGAPSCLKPSKSEGSLSLPSTLAMTAPDWASTCSWESYSSAGGFRLRGARQSSHGKNQRQPLAPVFASQNLSQTCDSLDAETTWSQALHRNHPASSSTSKAFGVTWSGGQLQHADDSPVSPAANGLTTTIRPGGKSISLAEKLDQVGQSTGPVGKSGRQRDLKTTDTKATSNATDVSRAETPPVMEMKALIRAGTKMLRDAEDPLCTSARWSQRSSKSPLEQGEDMLKESHALDVKKRIVREVLGRLDRDKPDPLRAHIANNIKLRLREEAKRDGTEGLAINQQCMNIRKQLASMANCRKELSAIRLKAASMLSEDPHFQYQYPS